MVSSTQMLFNMQEQLDSLKKEISELRQHNEELKNKLIYRDKQIDNTLYNLSNENFSTVALSADKYIRVGREGYRAGIEGANSTDDIVFWAGGSNPTTDCPFYVTADGRLYARTAYIGAGDTPVDDFATQTYANTVAQNEADTAYDNATVYIGNWLTGQSIPTGLPQLQSSGGNVIINNDTYYLYAANGGNGFYIDKSGNAVFTGNIQADSGYIASGVVIGYGGTTAMSDLATQTYANGVADGAYDDATSYSNNYFNGTNTMLGAKLKSTDGNLVINGVVEGDSYYLYAVKDGEGFYIDTSGNALFTGSVTGSKFYGTNVNSGFIMMGTPSGNYADFQLYRGGGTNPLFKIYDNVDVIQLQARNGGSSSSSLYTFLDSNGSTTYPKGTWDFQYCTTTNLYAKYA